MNRRRYRKYSKKGMSLAEVMISLALLSLLILLVGGSVTSAYQTAAIMQKLPSLYYGGQDLMESALDELDDKLTQKYRIEKEIDSRIQPDDELQEQADALNDELERTCEKLDLTLFGKPVTLYRITAELTKENGNSVRIVGGSAGGVRPERPVPVLSSVTVNAVGRAPSTNLCNAVGQTLSAGVSYADINREYVYSELFQWYVSVGDAHTVCFSDGTPGTDESLHAELIPVFPENYTLIPGGKSATLTVKDEWKGKFICCQVTPLSVNGKMGQSVMSEPVYISPLPEGIGYKAVLDASLITLDANAGGPVSFTEIPLTDASSGAFTGVIGPSVPIAGVRISERSPSRSRYFAFTPAASVRSAFRADPGDTVLAVCRTGNTTSRNFISVGANNYGFSNGTVLATGIDGWTLLRINVTAGADKFVIGGIEADIAELVIIGRTYSSDVNTVAASLRKKYALNSPSVVS